MHTIKEVYGIIIFECVWDNEIIENVKGWYEPENYQASHVQRFRVFLAQRDCPHCNRAVDSK